jgi:hypothetical protein
MPKNHPSKLWSHLHSLTHSVFSLKSNIDLTPSQADALFTSQLNTPHPTHLSPNAFAISFITTSPSKASKLHINLIKNGIIAPLPSDSSPDEKITVTTASLTPEHIATQYPYLSTLQRRRLISLLRFWEMECERWRVLDEEEAKILREMEEEEGMSGGARMDLGGRLRRNRMVRVMVPSLRVEGGDVNEGEVGSGEVL